MLDVLSVRWLLLGGLPLKFSLKYLQPYCIQLPSDSFVCWESMKGWTVERVVLLRLQINSRAFLFQSLRGNTWLVRDTHAPKILARSTAYCAWIIINSSRVTHTHPRHGGFLGIHKSCCEIHVFSPREIDWYATHARPRHTWALYLKFTWSLRVSLREPQFKTRAPFSASFLVSKLSLLKHFCRDLAMFGSWCLERALKRLLAAFSGRIKFCQQPEPAEKSVEIFHSRQYMFYFS